MSAERRWRLVPHFLLRRAGFPLEVLAPLAAHRAAAAAGEVAVAQAEASACRQRLLKELFPQEVQRLAREGDRAALRLLSRARRRVGRGRVSPLPASAGQALRAVHERFESALVRAHEAQGRLEASLAAEVHAGRVALRAFFARPEVREALFLLSPDLLEAMGPALDRPVGPTSTAAERALERRLYAFAQRLGAKNETTSFFGPLTYGRVAESAAPVSLGGEVPAGVVQREAFWSFWAAATLGKAASMDPALRRALPVRRIPAAAVVRTSSGHEARGPDGKAVALSANQLALFAAVDDARDVQGLAGACGLALPVAEAEVTRLERLGFVRRLIEPLSTTPRPLEDVAAQLPDVPESARWRTLLAQLTELLRAFERADLAGRRALLLQAERLFSEATATPARRAAGRTYADRTVLYEDCLGDMHPVRMSPAEAARLEDSLQPVLRMGAAYGARRHAAVVALATQVLEELGGPVPFMHFAEALDAQVARGGLQALDAPARALLEALGRKVEAVCDGRVARLTPEALRELAPEEGGGRFASPDVMLAAQEEGPARFVLGEVHPYVFAWGSQGHFAPQPEELQAALRADLTPWGGPERMAVVLRKRRHKGLVSDSFPGTFVEVTGRAVSARERRVAIGDLTVALEEGRPVLRGPHGPLTLYVGEDDHPHLRVFAPPLVEMPPVRLGEHTPRIEVGDCVLQRERWSLAEGSAQGVVMARDAAGLLLEVAALRQRLGLPRWVFVWSPTETKPLCLDLEAPLAQSHLQRLLSLGRLTVTEMLPGPGELWLRRAAGAFTSELRLAMVRER